MHDVTTMTTTEMNKKKKPQENEEKRARSHTPNINVLVFQTKHSFSCNFSIIHSVARKNKNDKTEIN